MTLNVDVTLEDLLGEHWLDAVDYDTTQIKEWDDSFTDAQAMRFRLDGICYTAIEDPDDGYRSQLGQLVTSEGTDMKNVFIPVWVFGRVQEKSKYDDSEPDTVELIDMWTQKVVLTVGTSHSDDYYPAFVAFFAPENMVSNHKLD